MLLNTQHIEVGLYLKEENFLLSASEAQQVPGLIRIIAHGEESFVSCFQSQDVC